MGDCAAMDWVSEERAETVFYHLYLSDWSIYSAHMRAVYAMEAAAS